MSGQDNFEVLKIPTGHAMVELMLKNKPRVLLKALIARGCELSVPIESLSDDDCETAVRFIWAELRKREAN